VEETHKMLKLLDHPCKSLGSYTDILLVKTRSLVNNVRFAVSYLNNVDVWETSSLGGNVSQGFNRGKWLHAPRPREPGILPLTYPRRERDPQRVYHSHQRSSRYVFAQSPTTDRTPLVDSFGTFACILLRPSSTSCSGVITTA